MSFRNVLFVVLAHSLLATWSLAGADVYHAEQLDSLTLKEGKLPADLNDGGRFRSQPAGYPRVILDGEGEAFVLRRDSESGAEDEPELVLRLPQVGTLKGRILFADFRSENGRTFFDVHPVRFELHVNQSAGNEGDRVKKAFLRGKREHYSQLQARNIPGSSWFRYQVRQATAALGEKVENDNRRNQMGWRRDRDLDNSFALFSGGRAVSENLQLEIALPTADIAEEKVALDSLQGITIREFDWESLVKNLTPKKDDLASLIPHDQHAIFFPSFGAMMELADYAADHGTPVLRAAEPRGEDARTRDRYEQQLGLPSGPISRLLGPVLIKSVAVTGSDPYLRTGTDVAVLFEAADIDKCQAALTLRVAQAAANNKTAERQTGDLLEIQYQGWRSPDRSFCSYVATLGDTVVVTNSPTQLTRLVEVHQQKLQSLADLDEYTFFRDRYPLGAEDEKGLLILSDATIRRWCSPRWRIATSRRTRAAAIMAHVQASQLDQLVETTISHGTDVQGEFGDTVAAGKLSLTTDGVQSRPYGTLAFHTPIAEHSFDFVTQQEAELYNRWRQGYQRNWRRFFDPIAVQFRMTDDKLAADLTVMPLIENTDYAQMIGVSQGVRLKPDSGDPHQEALAHFVLSLNTESETLKRFSGFARMFAQQITVDPLSWLGESIALYFDKDPYWKELATAEDRDEFLEANAHRLPVAVNIEVTSSIRLVAFLAGLRAYIEQTAPDLTSWENKKHKEHTYVQISERQNRGDREPFRLYYAAKSDALMITPSEDVLKRALDRRDVRASAEEEGKPLPAELQNDWLGENVGVAFRHGTVELLKTVYANGFQSEMQRLAWNNLPILNEWKRRYPDQDPVKIHERFWQRRLVCPGRGEYRWNERWQTMESTVYGHPAEPKEGGTLPKALADLISANFGLTFEENGLRAKVELIQRNDKD